VTPRGPAGATLQAALTRMLGGPVGPVRRAPWAYSSSVAIEEVRVPGGPVLLLKEMADRPRPSRPAFLHDPEREPEAYATLPAGLDLPVCHGTLAEGRRTWLVLEQVDGVPLWQREDLAAWEAAARWAARLHALPAVRTPRGLRQDAAHLHRWVDRALAMAPRGALGDVEAAARRAADRLAALPGVRLHGELYPSNVLVGGPPGRAAHPPRGLGDRRHGPGRPGPRGAHRGRLGAGAPRARHRGLPRRARAPAGRVRARAGRRAPARRPAVARVVGLLAAAARARPRLGGGRPRPGRGGGAVSADRRLVVNADDFGLSAGVNAGIVRAHVEGIVTSTSLMVHGAAAEAAAEAAAQLPRLAVGLHVDLAEWSASTGPGARSTSGSTRRTPAAVAAELEDQLHRFWELLGREPSHLDSHQHVHRSEPVRSLMGARAKALRVPLRHHGRVRYCGAF
jgi:hypothetical protein